jgi:hypothetical protein
LFKLSLDKARIPESLRGKKIHKGSPTEILYAAIEAGDFDFFVYSCELLNRFMAARIDTLDIVGDNGHRNPVSFYHWIIIHKQVDILRFVRSPDFKKKFPRIGLCGIDIAYGDRSVPLNQPPLAFALGKVELEMAKILIDTGASLHMDLRGLNLLQYLAINKAGRSLGYVLDGHKDKLGDITSLLNSKICSPDVMSFTSTNGRPVVIKDFKTAAFIALTNLDLDTLVVLLKNGADLSGVVEQKCNIIHLLIGCLSLQGSEKPLAMLFSKEVLAVATPGFLDKINEVNVYGATPLIMLCEAKILSSLKLSIMKLLLLNGAKLSYMDGNVKMSAVRQLLVAGEFDLLSEVRSPSFRNNNQEIPRFSVMGNNYLEEYLSEIINPSVDFFTEQFNDPNEALSLIDQLIDAGKKDFFAKANMFHRLSIEKGSAIWILFQCVTEGASMIYTAYGVNDTVQFEHPFQEIVIERPNSALQRIALIDPARLPAAIYANRALLIQVRDSAYANIFKKAHEIYGCAKGEISTATTLFLLDKKREIIEKLAEQKSYQEMQLSELDKLRAENQELKVKLETPKPQIVVALDRPISESPKKQIIHAEIPSIVKKPLLSHEQRIKKLYPSLKEYIEDVKVNLLAARGLKGSLNEDKEVNAEIEILLDYVEDPTNFQAAENFNKMVDKYYPSEVLALHDIGEVLCLIAIYVLLMSIAMFSIVALSGAVSILITKVAIDSLFVGGCVINGMAASTLISGLAMTFWTRPDALGRALQAVQEEVNTEDFELCPGTPDTI